MTSDEIAQLKPGMFVRRYSGSDHTIRRLRLAGVTGVGHRFEYQLEGGEWSDYGLLDFYELNQETYQLEEPQSASITIVSDPERIMALRFGCLDRAITAGRDDLVRLKDDDDGTRLAQIAAVFEAYVTGGTS